MVLFSIPVSAQQKLTEETAVAAAKRMLQTHRSNLDVPGMQLAVMRKGKLICSESFGFADLEKRVPVTKDTAFRIGSISKSLTTAGLGVLLEQKALSLDDPIEKYVPSFPKTSGPITIRQLAAHTSGIRHYRSAQEAESTRHYGSVTESLAAFKDDPLLFVPGARYEYSSFGYVLLSAVIEVAAKQNFVEFMANKVFRPLGLDHTTMDRSDRTTPFLSKGYVLDDNDERVTAPYFDSSGKWAAGGMISSAEDLVHFGNALLKGSLLRAETTATLFTSAKTADGKETGFGLGWEIRRDAAGRKVLVTDGSLPNTRAVLAIYPDDDVVIAVLANTGKNIFFNREEALMLGDLFLDTQGLDPSPGERKTVIGDYSYSTDFDGEPIKGLISVVDVGGLLQGSMTIPNSFFKDRSIAIPVIRKSGSRVLMLGLPGNWISVTLEPDGNQFKGQWRFGPIKGELRAVKLDGQRK